MGWQDAPIVAGNSNPFDAALAKEGVTGPLADLARSIYQQESGSGTNTRTSNAGAVGHMQVIPATFGRFADQGWDINDPESNIRAGLRYIKALAPMAGNDLRLIAAGYYGGEGAIPAAREGRAFRDPRNPNAPDTLQYGEQVASRIPAGQPAWMSAPEVAVAPATAAAPTRPFTPPKPLTNDNPNFIDNALTNLAAWKMRNIDPRLPSALRTGDIQGSSVGRAIQGAADLPVGAMQLAANAVGMGAPVNQEIANINQRTQQLRGPDAGFDVARLAGNIVNPAPYAAAARMIPAATMVGRAGQGAVVGAGMGAATPVTQGDYWDEKGTQVATGAAVGGALNAVVPTAIELFGKGAGKAIDYLRGRYGEVRAAQILREAAGADASKIQQILANTSDDVTATQATAGVKNDVWDALGQIARDNDKSSYFSRLFERQAQNRVNTMARMVGGANQTEAGEVANASRRALNMVTDSSRNAELNAANTGGTIGRTLQNRADTLGNAAAGRVQDVRDLSRAGQVAEDLAQSGRMRLDGGSPPAPGLPRVSGRYSYGTELAERAERAAQGAADDSLLLGEAGRFAQRQADSLAAYGLKPLDANAVTGRIQGMLRSPETLPGSTKERLLSRVVDIINAKKAENGGILDAKSLYELRKTGINEEIQKLLSGTDPKYTQKTAASLLSDVRPMIDKAIVDAGGTGWLKYLNDYAQGMRLIDQRRLGAKAMEFLQQSPNKFIELVKGNNPKVVNKIFQTTSNIDEAMAANMPALRNIAEELTRDASVKRGAQSGASAVAQILDKNKTSFQLPNTLDQNISLANRFLRYVNAGTNEKAKAAIVEAMKTPQGANALMNSLPSGQRNRLLELLGNYQSTTIAPLYAGSQGQ